MDSQKTSAEKMYVLMNKWFYQQQQIYITVTKVNVCAQTKAQLLTQSRHHVNKSLHSPIKTHCNHKHAYAALSNNLKTG